MLDSFKHSRALYERTAIWPRELLLAQDFGFWAFKRGVGESPKDIEFFWTIGLLRADLIESASRLKVDGLKYIDISDGNSYYADVRHVPCRSEGWCGIGSETPLEYRDIKLYFHPFRIYVLHHLWRVLDLCMSKKQILINPRGMQQLVSLALDRLKQWSASKEAARRVEYWNNIATLAIATEPLEPKVGIGITNEVGCHKEGDIQSMLKLQEIMVKPVFQKIGKDKFRLLHDELVAHGQLIDDNREIQTLLRFASSDIRSRLCGNLGCAFEIRIMAEVLRRRAEHIFGEMYREEDEVGLGFTPIEFKKNLLGAERLLDNVDPRLITDFLKQYFLNPRIAARVYVEGETEYFAVEKYLEVLSISGIDVVNLRGQVRQRGLLGFRDSLQADERAGVFSFVLIDKDREDHVKMLRKETHKDTFCGVFHLSDPDIEFDNFDLSELIEVGWQLICNMTIKNRLELPPKSILQDLRKSVRKVTTGKEFILQSKQVLLGYGQYLNKGLSWGEGLMMYALKNQIRVSTGKQRPILKLLEIIVCAPREGFVRSMAMFENRS